MPEPDPPEAARRLTEAYNRRDLDAIVSMYSEGAVWDMSALGVGIIRGRDAIHRFLTDWLGNYEEFEFALEETHDLGNGVAWAVMLPRGRPRGGKRFDEFRYGNCAVSEDGLIERMVFSTDIDAGRAAAERLAEDRRKNSHF
jgi:nuclear transport factor 2 (NTF2) superfamily protein